MNILKYLRLKQHWSQENVAFSLGVSKQCYSFYELGRMPLPTHMLRQIAVLYDVPMEFIHDRFVMNPAPDPTIVTRTYKLFFDLPRKHRDVVLKKLFQEKDK